MYTEIKKHTHHPTLSSLRSESKNALKKMPQKCFKMNLNILNSFVEHYLRNHNVVKIRHLSYIRKYYLFTFGIGNR